MDAAPSAQARSRLTRLPLLPTAAPRRAPPQPVPEQDSQDSSDEEEAASEDDSGSDYGTGAGEYSGGGGGSDGGEGEGNVPSAPSGTSPEDNPLLDQLLNDSEGGADFSTTSAEVGAGREGATAGHCGASLAAAELARAAHHIQAPAWVTCELVHPALPCAMPRNPCAVLHAAAWLGAGPPAGHEPGGHGGCQPHHRPLPRAPDPGMMGIQLCCAWPGRRPLGARCPAGS